MFKGLRTVLEVFSVTMHECVCKTKSQIQCPRGRGIWRTVHTSQRALWQQTPTDRPQSRFYIALSISPVNVNILHSKYEYGAWSESRFTYYSHCYVTWCPLTTGIVASQCPSADDASFVTRYLTSLISACLKPLRSLSRARFRYTRDYLTPGICNPIKPAAMGKLMPFPANIPTVML